jgi:hypothetical protein
MMIDTLRKIDVWHEILKHVERVLPLTRISGWRLDIDVLTHRLPSFSRVSETFMSIHTRLWDRCRDLRGRLLDRAMAQSDRVHEPPFLPL